MRYVSPERTSSLNSIILDLSVDTRSGILTPTLTLQEVHFLESLNPHSVDHWIHIWHTTRWRRALKPSSTPLVKFKGGSGPRLFATIAHSLTCTETGVDVGGVIKDKQTCASASQRQSALPRAVTLAVRDALASSYCRKTFFQHRIEACM